MRRGECLRAEYDGAHARDERAIHVYAPAEDGRQHRAREHEAELGDGDGQHYEGDRAKGGALEARAFATRNTRDEVADVRRGEDEEVGGGEDGGNHQHVVDARAEECDPLDEDLDALHLGRVHHALHSVHLVGHVVRVEPVRHGRTASGGLLLTHGYRADADVLDSAPHRPKRQPLNATVPKIVCAVDCRTVAHRCATATRRDRPTWATPRRHVCRLPRRRDARAHHQLLLLLRALSTASRWTPRGPPTTRRTATMRRPRHLRRTSHTSVINHRQPPR